MIMHIPRKRQGQIVEVSYGADSTGMVYRRTLDQSDRSVVWERAAYADLLPECTHAHECSCWDPANDEPGGDPDAWTPCEEPQPRGEHES